MALSPANARAMRAVTLVNLGQTYQQAADSLWACDKHQPDGDEQCAAKTRGARCTRLYSDRSAAHKAVQRELAERYSHGLEARDELRRLTLAQIDQLLRLAMTRAHDVANPQAPTYLLRATQLLAQRAKLEGLYAPIRVEGALTGTWEAEIATLAEQIAQQSQGQGSGHPG